MVNLKIAAAALALLAILVSPARGSRVGEPMPEFSLQTLAGQNLTSAGFKRKPLLLVFWNTWCPLCRKELPGIMQLSERFGPRGLAVLAVNTALNDSEEKVRDYWKKRGYTIPVAFDRSFKIGEAFKVFGVPTVILVDARGVVRYQQATVPGNMDDWFRKLSGN